MTCCLVSFFQLFLVSVLVFTASSASAMTDREEMELTASGKLSSKKARAGSSGYATKPLPSDTLFLNGWSPTIGRYLGYGSEIVIPIDIERYFGVKQDLIASGALPDHADLTLYVWDVDEDTTPGRPEVDNVYFNGTYIGTLSGHNNQWKANPFKVPIELVNLPTSENTKAENVIRIEIDTYTKYDWLVQIDWASLSIPAAPPVVLAHGIHDSSEGIADLKREIEKLGLPVHVFDFRQHGNSSIQNGGKQLKEEIQKARGKWKVDKVQIVAHSMGGLKAREYTTRYDKKGETVERVIQIATPNGGSSFATAQRIADIVGSLASFGLAHLCLWLADYTGPAFSDLTPRNMANYNKHNQLNPNVDYTVIAGECTGWSSLLPGGTWARLMNYLEFGKGDGIVSVESAHTMVPAHTQSPLRALSATHSGLVIGADKGGMVSTTIACLKNRLVEDTTRTCSTKQLASRKNGRQNKASATQSLEGSSPVAIICGTQTASGMTSIPFTIRKGSATIIHLYVEQNDISSMFLASPLGSQYSKTEGGVMIANNGHVRTILLDEPARGNWTLNFMPSSSALREYLVQIQEIDSGIELNPSLASEMVCVGDTFSISMQPKMDGTNQTGVNCSVIVQSPDSTSLTYPLRHTGNGVYSGSIPAPVEGRYSILPQVVISGVTYVGTLSGTAHSSSATIGADAGSGPVDEDGDGMYDWLVAKVGINGADASKAYRVLAELVDADGNHIEWASGTAEAGETFAELYFNGSHIFDYGKTAKYVVTDVRLFETGDDWEAQTDAKSNWLEVDGNTWAKFDHSLVSVAGTGTDSIDWAVGDETGNLSVGLDVNFDVSVAGTYNFSASLRTSEGTLVSSAYGTASLSTLASGVVGTERISMTFSGEDILAAGEAGPWVVTDVLLWNSRNELAPEGEYETRAWTLADFGGIDGTIWYVNAATGNDTNAGTRWATAKASIQAAIDVAENGDRIIVNDGVYAPIKTVDFVRYPDGKQLEIVSVNGADKTIIDATLTGADRVAYLGNRDRYTGRASGPQSTLDGFTIRGARENSSSSPIGAGAYGGILRRCVVTDNHTGASGGGVACAICESCTIAGNKSTDWMAGGAYACDLRDCIVENNEAAANGGGTVGGKLERCIVRKNKAGEYGGGHQGGNAFDCLFVENEAGLGGGAVAGANLSRCTVVNNRTDGTGGGAIGCVLHSSILWGNKATEQDNNVNTSHGAYNDTVPRLPGTGNISDNPQFRNEAAGDYHLSFSSPCIDAGAGPTDAGRTDLDGEVRWQGNRMDMGAYEFANSLKPTFITADLWVDGNNGNDANSGTARDRALATINAAVEKAADGATIHVLPGTYTPITLDGRRLTIQSTDGAENTTISGAGVAQCAWLGLDSESVLEGFTLCHGFVPMDGGGVWGGTLRDCIIRDNTADGRGGGAVMATLERCIIRGNSAPKGSGGGAIWCDLVNCLVTGNSAVTGGGIWSDGHTNVNCTVVGNSATKTGGGIMSAGYVWNSIVWGNSAPDTPDLWGCDAWYTCSPDAENGWGNIAEDPLFMDEAAGDFRLRPDSPCVDAGGNDFVVGETDLVGNARIFRSVADMGAYEQGSGPIVRLDSRGDAGGTSSIIAIYGAAMPAITVPTRNGYVFSGYFTGTDGTGTQYYTASGSSARVWDRTSETTLYAKWTKDEFTVRFAANGGMGTMENQIVQRNAAAKLSANKFTRSGYTFIGWSKGKTGAIAYANGASVKNLAAAGGSITLYAQWAKNKYTVKYNANSGTLPKGKKMDTQAMTYGKAAKLRKNAFTKDNSVFLGWATSKKGEVVYKNAQGVKNLRTDGKTTTLYAQWAKKTYKVAFNANSGTLPKGKRMDVQVMTYGKEAKLRKNVFTKKDCVFLGWATSKNGKVVYKNAQAVKNLRTDGKTTTLHAKWAKKTYKVAFQANGGTGKMAVQTLTWGKAAKLSANQFTRKGWTFAGWSKSAGGAKAYGDRQSVKNLVADGSTVTLHAIWTDNGSSKGIHPDAGDGGETDRVVPMAPAEPWVVVTTSDGADGRLVADGDETTGWSPGTADGSWVVLAFADAVEVADVEVIGENLPEGTRILISKDADDWREGVPGRAQYVWVLFPASEAPPVVREIRVKE